MVAMEGRRWMRTRGSGLVFWSSLAAMEIGLERKFFWFIGAFVLKVESSRRLRFEV